LGEYLRQSVMKNGAVAEFVALVERGGGRTRADLGVFLRARFPFVEASEEVWDSYTMTFLSWIRELKLVEVEGDLIAPDRASRDLVVATLGNLMLAGRGSRPVDAPFVPSKGLEVELGLLRRARAGGLDRSSLRRSEEVALNDLVDFGAVEVQGAVVAAILTEEEFLGKAKRMLDEPGYRAFMAAVRSGVAYEEALARHLGLRDLAVVTRHALGLKLYSWGKFFGERSVRRATPGSRPDVPALFALFRPTHDQDGG
jgi:hypothetical protein